MSIIVRHGSDAASLAEETFLGILEPGALDGKTVLVKPNVGRISTPGTGVCTNPEVVRGVIRAARKNGADRILVGDGPIWGIDIWKAMEATGIKAVCDDEGVECVDLDGFGYDDIAIADGIVVQKLRFSALLKDMDCIVTVPVMKTHMYTGVSLSIKNMKGCLYKMEKTKLHRLNKEVPDHSKGRVLDYGIADMASVLMPQYTVIDGSIGMEGLGPSVGTPRPLGVIMASDDPLAADFAAVQLMGMPVDSVPHLNLIRERLRPELDPENLIIEPSDFMRYAGQFEPASLARLENEYPNLRIVERGTCSACSAALMVFVKTHGKRFESSRELTLGTGKDLRQCDLLVDASGDGDIFCIGNCASGAAREMGKHYCKGCPPVGSSILSHIMGEDIDDWKDVEDTAE